VGSDRPGKLHNGRCGLKVLRCCVPATCRHFKETHSAALVLHRDHDGLGYRHNDIALRPMQALGLSVGLEHRGGLLLAEFHARCDKYGG
jgi:hypothetical protein